MPIREKRTPKTKQQKLEAQRRWSSEYYYHNQALVQKKNLRRYHDKKAKLNASVESKKETAHAG